MSNVPSSSQLTHCLSIKDFNQSQMLALFKQADTLIDPFQRIDFTQAKLSLPLEGITVANCFFEPSTRTRSSFELAAKYLGATVLNFPVSDSSQSKGETLVDTLKTLEAMSVQCFVVRHNASGSVHFLARQLGSSTHVINAGDGCHEHPTQALLDMYTLWRRDPSFVQRRVAIVGDIKHSRVARSQIYALTTLGVKDIRLIAPPMLLPACIELLGTQVYHDLWVGLDGVDVVIALRLQKERLRADSLSKGLDLSQYYGLSRSVLSRAAPKAVIMHPGPVNWGHELSNDLMQSSQSVIHQQVTHGVAIRMALFKGLINPGIL